MKNIIKSHWKYLAICLLFVFIAGFAGTYVQFLKGELLDTALDGISAGGLRLAIAFFAAIAVEMASFYGYDYFRGRFSVANKKSLRSLYFDWLLMRSPVEAMAVQQGEFVAQYTDQIDQVNESYLDNIPLLIEISSKTLIVSAALFWLDYRVALLTLFLLRYCQELCANTTASLMKLVQRRPNRPRACSAWLPVSGPPVVRQGWRSHLRSP